MQSFFAYFSAISWLGSRIYVHGTKFQLILPVDSQNVTKNGTGHRMQVERPQICQINCLNSSFQNMYCMLLATIGHLARKIYFVQKTPQIWLFWCARIWVTWIWKALDAKPLTPGQPLGCTWKLWGLTLQISYVEGRWHQNWAHMSPLHTLPSGHGNLRKSYFGGKTLRTRKFSAGNFWGCCLRNPYALRVQKI